jgi:hypothetical protein
MQAITAAKLFRRKYLVGCTLRCLNLARCVLVLYWSNIKIVLEQAMSTVDL